MCQTSSRPVLGFEFEFLISNACCFPEQPGAEHSNGQKSENANPESSKAAAMLQFLESFTALSRDTYTGVFCWIDVIGLKEELTPWDKTGLKLLCVLKSQNSKISVGVTCSFFPLSQVCLPHSVPGLSGFATGWSSLGYHY